MIAMIHFMLGPECCAVGKSWRYVDRAIDAGRHRAKCSFHAMRSHGAESGGYEVSIGTATGNVHRFGARHRSAA
jgi:hypothetical protein